MRRYVVALSVFLCMGILLTMCRKDEGFSAGEQEAIEGYSPEKALSEKGVYILNNGGKGNYQATLDYIDAEGVYHRNYYAEQNPDNPVLGDDGVALLATDYYLFIVLRGSHKVVVADIATAKRITDLRVNEPSSVMMHGQYVYVTSMIRPGTLEGAEPLGELVKFHVGNFVEAGRTAVGCQPVDAIYCLGVTREVEKDVEDGSGGVVKKKVQVKEPDCILVANSGEYLQGEDAGYDKWVSVVNSEEFRQVGFLKVNPHPFRLFYNADAQVLWAASRKAIGNAESVLRLYAVTPDYSSLTEKVDGKVYTAAKGVAKVGISEKLGTSYLNVMLGKLKPDGAVANARYASYSGYAAKDNITLVGKEEREQIESPMCFNLSPDRGKSFVLDARNFTSSGKLFCFDAANGKMLWSVRTGIIPIALAFVK